MDISLQTPIKKKIINKHVCNDVACTRTFRQASKLRGHIRFHHLGIFDFPCEKCNKKFEQKGSLVFHEKTVHSNERPYSCEFIDQNQKQCEFKFKKSYDLRRHMQTHLENKQFQCGKCEKSYGRSCNLKRHVDKIHEGISATFECTDCPNEYETYSGLWNHFLFKHADRSCPRVMAAIAKHRLSQNKSQAKRRANDPVFKIHCDLSSAFGAWMRRHGRSKNCRMAEILSLSYEGTIEYLNDNPQGLKYGDPGTDVDHIRPKSSFKKAGPVEQRELWCYWNLQLMTSHENRKVKRAYYDPIAYTESENGQQIAKLRPGWVAEFGETEGPDIEHLDEDMELPDTADDDGYLSGVSEFTDYEDSDCSDPEASDEDAGGDME
jgi:hypothetical protein